MTAPNPERPLAHFPARMRFDGIPEKTDAELVWERNRASEQNDKGADK